MSRMVNLPCALVLVALSVATAQDRIAQEPVPAELQLANPQVSLVTLFPDQDVQGKAVAKQAFSKAKGIVLIFLNPECPVANHYAPEINRLQSKGGDELLFFGVHSDPSVTREQAVVHAKEYRLQLPVVLDPEQRLAEVSGVWITPEVAVITPDGRIVYRGRIDDRYSENGKRRDEPRRRDLELVIDAIRSGASGEVPSTKAYGCPIPKKRDRK